MQISIDSESAVPLHVQLLNQIRHLIMSGEWTPGSRLPSEAALGRQLQISRGTIRQALKNAEIEGLIARVPGKGTFVAQSPADEISSRLIGYITSDFMSDVQQQLLRGAESIARARGYRILFCSSNQDIDEENRLLEQMQIDQVGGILVWPIHGDTPSRRLFQFAETCEPPMVLMDRTLKGLMCDYVSSDNFTGAYAATEHLIQLGHRRIAFLTRPPLQLSTVAERLHGYQQAMRDAGLTPPAPWLIGTTEQESGAEYALRISGGTTSQEIAQVAQGLERADRPTAILALNDLTALLALKAADLVDLRVPQDLSLVGFDDMDFVAFLPTPLTTVAQDTFALGERAAELLIERIEGYDGPPRSEFLSAQLNVRASTAPPQAP